MSVSGGCTSSFYAEMDGAKVPGVKVLPEWLSTNREDLQLSLVCPT